MKNGSTETFDLLQRWREGDQTALEFLLQRDLGWLEANVRKQLGEELHRLGDTGDFVHETVVEIFNYGPRFVISNREQFRGLLARIVVNVLRSRHRHMHALKRTPTKEAHVASDSVLLLDAPQKDVTRPDEIAQRAEEKDWLRLGILLLEPSDQEVLEMHMDGLGDDAIGQRLDIQANTARMRRNRATGRLAQVVLKLKQGRSDDAMRIAEQSA